MQVDAHSVHDDEGTAEHERDAARDDEARAEAKRQEANGQHDDDGLDERLDEVVDGLCDDARLVRYLVDLEADGHVLLDLADLRLEIIAELQDIATVLHRDGDADGRLAVVVHLRRSRLLKAALDLGDIAEPQHLAPRIHGHLADGLDIVELARHAHVDVVGVRLDHAAWRHVILLCERVHDDLRADAELGELGAVHLDVDLLLLFADEFDFLDARHIEEQSPRLLGLLAHLLIRVAVACHGVDRAVDIVEAVVVVRAVDALRQFALDVLAEIAHILPCVAYLFLRDLIGELDVDDGLARARLTLDVVESLRVLELLLELVRNLLLHLLRRRARPGGRDNHLAYRELRVLHAAELVVGKDAADSRHDDEVPDEHLVLQGDFCQISHLSASVRTAWPSRSLWTPAVTTTSVGARPCTRTVLSPKFSTSTLFRATVLSSVTTHTSGASSVW